MTRPSGLLVPLDERHAVLAQDLHGDAGEWRARLDRKDEDVAAPVGVFLHQQANVGDENEATIAHVADRPFLHRIPFSRAHEKEAALAPAVGRHLEMTGEVEGGIVRPKFVLDIDRLMLERDPRNVFLVELAKEFRVLETAVGLRDEMIDLVRGDAGDFVFDLGDGARFDREFALAVERENSALALNLDFARQSGHGDDRVIGLRQRKTADGFDAFIDANVEAAFLLDAEFEGVGLRLFVLGRNDSDGDRPGVLQDFVGHFARTLPAARSLGRGGFRRIFVARLPRHFHSGDSSALVAASSSSAAAFFGRR